MILGMQGWAAFGVVLYGLLGVLAIVSAEWHVATDLPWATYRMAQAAMFFAMTAVCIVAYHGFAP